MNTPEKSIRDSSIKIRGDVSGSILQTGDGNTATLHQVSLPAAASVDIKTEITALQKALAQLNAPDQRKIDNALEDAQTELEKSEPDKDEVGQAIDRALSYAQKAETFNKALNTMTPHLVPVVAWLGTNWDKILHAVGLMR